MKLQFREDRFGTWVSLSIKTSLHKDWVGDLEYSAVFSEMGYLRILEGNTSQWDYHNTPEIWRLFHAAMILNPNVQRYFQEKDETRKGELKVIIEKQLEWFLRNEKS